MVEELRLSTQQRRLWQLGDRLGVPLPSCLEVELCGELDEDALRRALERLVARHEVLRTTFERRPGLKVPVQVIGSAPGLAFEDPCDRSIASVRRDHRRCAVDLARGPLLRAALIEVEPRRHRLMLAAPALIADSRSLSNLVEELAALYREVLEGPAAGDRAPDDEILQYADFSEWQWELLEEEEDEAEAARVYWARQDPGSAPPPIIGDDRVAAGSFSPAAEPLPLGRGLPNRLAATANQLEVSESAVVLAAWKVLLWRLGGRTDPLTSVLVDGRRYEELEGGLGPYARCLPLRGRFAPDLRFDDAVAQVAGELEEGAERQEHLDPGLHGLDSGAPVSHFGFEFEGSAAPVVTDGSPLSFRPLRREVWPEPFRLALSWLRRDEGASTAELRYDGGRVERSAAVRVAAQLCRILEQVLEDPRRPLGGLDLLTGPERHALVVEHNDTGRGPAAETPFHHSIEARAAAHPDRTALVFEDRRMTYGELDRRANRVARRLRRLGVEPETRVAVLAERCPELVVIVLGVFKAGGAYVPLDPEHPPARLSGMLDDAGARVLVIPRGGRRAPRFDGPVVRLGRDAEPAPAGAGDDVAIAPENLAYVVFTSGSTGRPKGVAVEHRQLTHYVRSVLTALDVDEGASFATVSTFAADLGHTALFGALAGGGCLHILSRARVGDAAAFEDYLERRRVDVLKIVPSHLAALTSADDTDGVLPLDTLVLGGEAVGAELLRRLLHGGRGVRIYNHYGPTETTVGASVHELDDRLVECTFLPLGRPLSGARTYVVDEALHPLPRRLAGELVVAGGGVARGYLGRPAATAERFVPDPFAATPGSRVYRTGDGVRFGERGDVEFLGRTDDQVKIRGHRVEPGEIRQALEEHPDVLQSVVVLRRDEGRERLVAYVVPRRGAGCTGSDLRRHVASRLPEPMVPAVVMLLDALPLTVNGKVDRDRLPAPVQDPPADSGQAQPRNAVESTLCAVWAKVLGVPEVGIFDDFFELGGDSVLVIQVTALAKREGIRIEPKELFESHTVAELARGVELMRPASAHEAEEVAGSVPLTPIQHWFFELEIDRREHWNQAVLLELSRTVEPRILQTALARLVEHHDALRHRFHRASDGGWRQEVAPAGGSARRDAPLDRIDLRRVPAAQRTDAVESATAAVQSGLDLEHGPLVRGALLELGGFERAARLLLVIHHLVVDAVSWGILLGDFEALVEELARGETPRLPSKTTSFKRWGERLTRHVASGAMAEEAERWRSVLEDARARLPVDFPTLLGPDDEASARTVTVRLGEDETHRLLHEVTDAGGCRVDEALAAAVAEAVCGWTGDANLLLELEGHGREPLFEDVDLSRTVGWFTTRFPVRVEYSPEAGDVEEALRAVKEAVRATPARGIGFGLLRYLGRDPVLSERPGPEIGLNYLGRLDASLPAGGWLRPAPESSGPTRAARAARPLPLQVVGGVFDGRLRVEWSYSANRHRRETIEGLADRFAAALRTLVDSAKAGVAVARTPVDFPLARLSSGELERVLAGRGDVEDIYPLSPLQEGLLFHTLYEPSSGLYVGQLDCILEGDLDVDAFERAWRHLVERHSIFRTCFAWEGLERPLQLVLRGVELRLERDDWRDATPEERDRWLEERLAEDRREGYDLSRAPLMRLALFRIDVDAYRFVWSHHHLLLDGWAVALLADEVFTVYRALRAGETVDLPPARPYREYIEWLESRDLDDVRRFWREQLRGFTKPTPLEGVRTGEVEEGREGLEDLWLTLEAETTATIRSWLRGRGLTTSSLVQGIWGLLLSYYSAEEDVVFGSTVAGRPADLEGFEEMIGLFINTLPVRVRIRPGARFAPWLEDLQKGQVEARRYEHSPLVEIQGQSEVPRGEPLFESVLVVENYPMDDSHELGLEIREFRYSMKENFPLIFTVLPGEELRIKIKYESARFSRPAIERMASLFLAAFRAVAPDPEIALDGVLDAVGEEDRKHRLRSGEKLRRVREQAFRKARRKKVIRQ